MRIECFYDIEKLRLMPLFLFYIQKFETASVGLLDKALTSIGSANKKLKLSV